MKILLASPRGFCAGVNMAIESLQMTLREFGPPVYVYHEIVHNRWVVEHFRGRGVVFVEAAYIAARAVFDRLAHPQPHHLLVRRVPQRDLERLRRGWLDLQFLGQTFSAADFPLQADPQKVPQECVH